MDVSLVIKQRLEELPSRTDIYDKNGKFLKLPSGRLAKLADHQRKEIWKRSLDEPPKPLYREVRKFES